MYLLVWSGTQELSQSKKHMWASIKRRLSVWTGMNTPSREPKGAPPPRFNISLITCRHLYKTQVMCCLSKEKECKWKLAGSIELKHSKKERKKIAQTEHLFLLLTHKVLLLLFYMFVFANKNYLWKVYSTFTIVVRA